MLLQLLKQLLIKTVQACTHETVCLSALVKVKEVAQALLECVQSLFISILSGAGVIRTIEDSKNLQNFLIACEMLPASIFMLWAFPYTDYKTSGELSCFMRLSAAKVLHMQHWKAALLSSQCLLVLAVA